MVTRRSALVFSSSRYDPSASDVALPSRVFSDPLEPMVAADTIAPSIGACADLPKPLLSVTLPLIDKVAGSFELESQADSVKTRASMSANWPRMPFRLIIVRRNCVVMDSWMPRHLFYRRSWLSSLGEAPMSGNEYLSQPGSHRKTNSAVLFHRKRLRYSTVLTCHRRRILRHEKIEYG